MKAFKILTAQTREVGKKTLVKYLLKNNLVPGVIYLKGGKSACISLPLGEMNVIVDDPSGKTRLYEIELEKQKIMCILKEVQFNAANDTVRSFDFMEVNDNDVVKVNVPVRVMNKEICPGVKNGGDVYVLSYNVDLKCNVNNIPYAIEIDVKDCDMGQKFFLSDIKLPEGCKMINNVILLRIAGRRVIKEAATAATTDATADATDSSTDSTAVTSSTAESTK